MAPRRHRRGHRASHEAQRNTRTVMQTYDPADRILYVRMTREADPYATPLESGRTCKRLPTGYANRSSRTCLRRNRMCLTNFVREPDLSTVQHAVVAPREELR